MSQPISYRSADPFGRMPRDGSFRWSRFIRSAAMLMGWSCAVLLGMAIFGGIVSAGSMALSIVLGPAAFLLFVVCLTQFMRTLRRRRAAVVLSYVEQAVRLNLPLPRMLRAAQYSETARTARCIGGVCDLLEMGAPLDIALETQVPEMPQRALRLTGAAQRLGNLPGMLRSLVVQERKNRSGEFSTGMIDVAYVLTVLVCIGCTVSVYVIWVLPKFQQIMKDFDMTPPAIMGWMLTIGTVAAWIILPIGGAMLLLYPAMRLWEVFIPADHLRPRRKWIGWVLWYTPFARGVVRDRGLADVCRVAVTALRAGFPLDRALDEAVDLEINPVLRGQIHDWLDCIREGLTAADAARHAGLPALLVGMVGTAQASGGMAEVFEFLWRYYETRFSRMVLVLQGAVGPLTSLIFGIVVCGVAMSIFQPMIRLIEKVGLQWDKF
ncbi:MAG: type II secretion system F family protein [Planctomycetota bacterium]|nr:type II secretion system F family protein [Planctomycetota bacterium]